MAGLGLVYALHEFALRSQCVLSYLSLVWLWDLFELVREVWQELFKNS